MGMVTAGGGIKLLFGFIRVVQSSLFSTSEKGDNPSQSCKSPNSAFGTSGTSALDFSVFRSDLVCKVPTPVAFFRPWVPIRTSSPLLAGRSASGIGGTAHYWTDER